MQGATASHPAPSLLYSFADRKMHDFFLERDYPVATELMRVSRILTDEPQEPDDLRFRLKMDAETFDRAVEKLAAQGAASIDFNGGVRRNANTAWQSGYEQQVEFRRSQIDRMMAFATTQQCRMGALIRHFGDTADAHKPCGHCDFCNPSSTTAQTFAEPTASEDRDLRTILRALDGQAKATGKLFTDLALTKDRNQFEALLDGLARAGLIAIESTTFTNPEGKVIPYKKASLTHEGNEVESGTPLGVVLRGVSTAASKSKNKRTAAGKTAKAETAPANLTPSQQALEANLRGWRKAEAAKTGKPAFIVCSDAALLALVVARPQTITQLLTVSGFGKDKAERYGADLCALCRDAGSGQVVPPGGAPIPSRPGNLPRLASASAASAPAPTFKRERTVVSEPSIQLDPIQQELEDKLRAWRKAESEKMGLPQFFVLGTTTLRSIVLERPRTLQQLLKIQGIGQEKVDRFGASILEVCNG